ncbi:MAG: response regulator transcription factor [Halieaceae bacterium]|jgi:DNA-binding NarL/FixJ family response regulator|nr:response regulator transcription factor [Halieaceae bacterium]
MYQILVADDHPMIREAIASAITSSFEGATVAETEDLQGAHQYAEDNPDTDLILLDLNMPGMDGLNGIINLRTSYPDIPVVVLSAEEDKNVVLKAVTYGAVGFITKSMPREKITEAIRQILDGQIYLPPDIIRKGSDQGNKGADNGNRVDPELISTFTRRQLLVFEHMAKGQSNKEIAYELNIAETTVKAHVSAILRKLGVHSRLKAILCARDINFDQYLRR